MGTGGPKVNAARFDPGDVPYALTQIARLAEDRQVSHIGDVFTADLIARYVQGKVAASNN
jgi:hypothetical protein